MLFDTSVLIDHLRGHEPATRYIEGSAESGEPLVSSELVRFELLAGLRERDLERVEGFSAAMTWIPVTEAVARQGSRYARRYRPGHGGIDDIDYLLAATATVFDIALVTRNVRHFPMFKDLLPPY